jgi:hypothetical protein
MPFFLHAVKFQTLGPVEVLEVTWVDVYMGGGRGFGNPLSLLFYTFLSDLLIWTQIYRMMN